MELIYSSVLPVRPSGVTNFREAFERQLVSSGEMKIATGYVSEDSLMELKAILAHYKDRMSPKSCDMIIGMHGREGFTRPQYEAACSLGKFLSDNRIGAVRVCTAFKFHGKVYSFLKDGLPRASIVGSSNVSNVLGLGLQWEVDTLVTEAPTVEDLVRLHQDIALKATKPILEYADVKFIDRHDLLEGCSHVEKVGRQELERAQRLQTGIVFDIPLKAEAKSNLNAYFGKGREAPTGAVRPRPWYEVEIIVPKAITSLPGYPAEGEPFTVYTDDGWQFTCKVNGQNAKNLRSEGDLQILGRWIKGRMEAANVLRVGEAVTPTMLSSYGADRIRLSATNDPRLWLLDFSPKTV